MSESLYFIAIIPPEEIQHEVTALKHLVAEKFGSKHALKSPPHITLHMPFKWKDKKRELLDESIKTINDSLDPFLIKLSGFDFFEPRVVFIKVLENPSLVKLQGQVGEMAKQKLKLDNLNYKNKPFHPHMTIAFRDLRKRKFFEAKEFFERLTFTQEFTANRIELLKHDGSIWRILT